MRNLRLTEAVVSDLSSESSFGLLAKTMNGGLVSNMTLEGEVNITYEGSDAQDVGGLIGQISAGEINTITSMVKITYTHKSAGSSMGGIVGHVSAGDQAEVKLYYNSNYGPITGQQKARSVGGIVGSFASNRASKVTIDHCFNGSSVLAGYSGTNANDVEYHAGGILGFIEGENSYAEITNCYNAGIIKAGNKSHTDMAYAAGIVAHSATTDVSKVAISNCYNEGSIEALGVDPEYYYFVSDEFNEGVYDSNGLLSTDAQATLYLVQTNNKNVSGYHIADITVTNCAKAEVADLELDGAMLDSANVTRDAEGNITSVALPTDSTKDCIYASQVYNRMYQWSVNSRDDELLFEIDEGDSTAAKTTRVTTESKWLRTGTGRGSIKFRANDAINIVLTSIQPSMDSYSVLQSGFLNLPQIIVETQQVDTNLSINYRWDETWNGHERPVSISINQTINRNYYYDFSTDINKTITTMENALGAPESTSNADLKPSKSSFGPSYNADNDKNQPVSINGDNYTLAYNYGNAFENKTYSYTWTTTIDNIGITEDSAIDSSAWGYNVTATGTNGRQVEAASANNNPSITMQVSGSGLGRTFTFSYRGGSLGTNPTLSGTISYSNSIELSLNEATSDFVYLNENSFAIELNDNYSIDLGAGGTSTDINYLANFVTQGATLTDASGGSHDNVLVLKSNGQNYYFVLNTANNRLIYYTNATVTGVNGVDDGETVNSKGDNETLLDVVESIPTSFDIKGFETTLSISQIAPNDYSAWKSKTEEDSFTFNGDYDVSDGYSLEELSSLGAVSSYNLTQNPDASGNYSLTINFATTFRRLLVYGEFLNTSMLGVYSSGAANTASRYIDSQYEVTGTYSIDSDYHSVLTLYSTNSFALSFIESGTYIFSYEIDIVPNAYVEQINSTSFRIRNETFKFEESLTGGNEDISITYSRSIDYSGAVISGDSIMATNEAYYLGATGTAVATYKISSVTNKGDQNVVYNADGALGILTAGATMQGSWDNVEILQTYNGTTDRPIKAGDEITFTYDRSKNTVDGTTTETYKTATFNVVQEENGTFSLEYKEGFSFSGSYTTEGEEGTEDETPLNADEIKAISNALNVHNNNGVLYIYSDDENINIDSVDRTTNVTDALTISGIERGESTASLQLSGINIINENDNLFSREGTELSTYFNNIDGYFALTERWGSGNVDIDLTNYTEPSGSVKAIILMNDIFAPDNFAIGFNIFGNGHAIISSASDNLFGNIGDATNEITIKDLAFVGATKSKISSGFSENATINFVNIDFYGTVYNNINDNTLGLNGISGTNINIYTAIYSKNGVNSSATATYRGVVFAGDGQNYGDDGGDITLNQATLSETVGENTVNTFIVIKAGDGANGGLTLSSGLPSVLDVKAGGAAGTITINGTAQTNGSGEAGISGGVYRSDEINNDKFKERAFGKMFVSNERNGEHFSFASDANSFPGIVVGDGDDVIENATIIIKSPNSSDKNHAGLDSGFAAFYEGGGDDDYTGIENQLLSSGGRGDFDNDPEGTHLGDQSFKYLVLDAAGNSVYSQSSFISAGYQRISNGGGSEDKLSKSEFLENYAGYTVEIKSLVAYDGALAFILKEPVRFTVSQENFNSFVSGLSVSQVIVAGLGAGESITQEQLNSFKNDENSDWDIYVY